MGGSAGGLESASAILRALPPAPGLAIVMLQHLSPDYTSHLSDYFRTATRLPVRQIEEGMAIEANHVYVLPSDAFVEITGMTLHLVKRRLANNVALPIDHFLNSLALDRGPHAVGVILSGGGADGSIGLTAIKNEGGVTFAETDRTAKHPEMPHNAVDTGCVDYVLTPEEIARQLVEIARLRHLPLDLAKEGETEHLARKPQQQETPPELRRIFAFLRQHHGVDFNSYKRSTVHRRLTRRLLLHRMDSLEAYLELLRKNPDESQALFNDLLINVTSFFRDPPVFLALSRKIIPAIIKERKEHGGDIRIWVPGCATGQEVYSIAITVSEALRKSSSELRLQIFGTDLSEDAIAVARAGVYPPVAVKDIAPDRLKRFFQKVNGNYQISRSIRDCCTFARQNLCQDPPFSRLDLVSCRNVLIYFGADLQRRCFPVFHYALQPGGFLLLGPAETVSHAPVLFQLVDKRNKIYAKKSTPSRPSVNFGKAALQLKLGTAKATPVMKRENDTRTEIQREADRVVLTRVAPAGVVIDAHLQVLQFRGQTAPFLEHHSGDASLSLLHMVRPSLAMDLRALIHKALKQNAPVRGERLVSELDGDAQLVNIEIFPFRISAPADDRCLLILFRPCGTFTREELEGPAASKQKGAAETQQKELRRVRDELRATKESLQAIIEEQEATNEELKSANEEIESSNEELQSSNEELETAKEELQSTNEELQTLNEELNTRNAETAQINNDLQNLLSSINLPIVMVDNALTIRRVTPLAEKLFNTIPSDVGRKLTDMKPNLDLTDLEATIRKVIDTLETQEREVHDKSGRTYSLRVRPYRTRDHKIDGAVITLIDVEEILRARPTREYLRRSLEVLADTLHEPAILLLPDLRVCAANRPFREAFDLRKKDVEDHLFFEIDSGRWDFPALRSALESVPPPERKVRDIESPPVRGEKSQRTFLISGCSLPVGHDSILLLTFTSPSEHRTRHVTQADK